uniref:Transposase (putative) gypsy type domain-containing protein n=1 Tax=Fagus sylvatica TaxID=28930 RepID=A0A2N9GVW0_FAGSY
MRCFVRSRINVEVSFQSTDDTRRRVLGRCDRGAVSSDLALNVKVSLRAADDTEFFGASDWVFFSVFPASLGSPRCNLGPPPLEGYVSSDSVLHRLAAELYSIVCPALSTWEAVRSRMAANETEWSLPLSEELPEGLSDESPGRVTRENSSEAAPSTSGTRQSGWVDRSWKALSYFSSVTQDDIDRIRRRYQIPDDVVLRIPDSDERACCPKYVGDVAFYEADLKAGLRFPMQPFVRELLDFLGLAPGQVNPNGWRTIIACMVMWRVCSNGSEDLSVDEFLFCYEPCQIALSRGFWTFKNRDANSRVVQGLPTSDRIWKDKYFFVCGDNWERLPQEDPRDFVGVRRSWGTPSPSVLDRPLLNSVWQERIWRILEIEDRRYNIYIEPDLLATFSLGPVPSSSVKALQRANKKRVNTMKLNKNRLKQMAQSGEEALPRPSVPIVTPPIMPTAAPSVQKAPTVIMVDSDLTPPSAGSTINQSPLVAMDRAKAAITPQDADEYAVAHTDDLSLLHGPFSYAGMGLTEAVVMARRCASVEEDLALLRAKSISDEAEMKNSKRAVMELTRDRKEALIEAENLRKELKAREDDTKAAGAKEAAVSDFRASEAFEDINTRYFLSGFEAFRKQAVQRFPGLDFSALQPYDDEDSVMDASQDQAGDEDVTSK